jgi:hypothetical protein
MMSPWEEVPEVRGRRRRDRAAGLLLLLLLLGSATARADEAAELQAQFEDHTGIPLVFEKKALPPGPWYRVLVPLEPERKVEALKLVVREMKRYPRHYLKSVGLTVFGLFAGCGAKTNDGFHEWSESMKAYAYLGMWDDKNAALAAYYDEDKLVRTFHHEIFHHVDATRHGVPDLKKVYPLAKARLAAALSGKAPFPALPLTPDEEAELVKRAGDAPPLADQVSAYSKKSLAEDRAETARYVLMHLPAALLQASRSPRLPGSQRILEVLWGYEASLDPGPSARWFIDEALGHPTAEPATPPSPGTPGTPAPSAPAPLPAAHTSADAPRASASSTSP